MHVSMLWKMSGKYYGTEKVHTIELGESIVDGRHFHKFFSMYSIHERSGLS